MLRINKEKMMQDFLTEFEPNLKEALDSWKNDIEKFSSLDFIKKLGVPKADYKISLETFNNMITVFFKANPTLLADIYGTGSEMIEDQKLPEVFNDYWNNRGAMAAQVNPTRKGHEIAGRPAGVYQTIFGNKRTSEGRKAGESIEGQAGIKVIKPDTALLNKYFGTAIEIANKFFKTTYLRVAINNTIKGMDLSKYVIEVN